MSYLKSVLFLLVFSSLNLFAAEVTCRSATPAAELVETLRSITDCMYKDIAALKVNHDGEGKLSVFYENGVPKILKLTYTNSKGTSVQQITFDDLEKGRPLIYENPEKKGRAIVFEREATFKQGANYKFKLNVRSKMSPETFITYPLNFDSAVDAPRVSSQNKQFKKMVFSPGISFLSWDGTFTKVEFKD